MTANNDYINTMDYVLNVVGDKWSLMILNAIAFDNIHEFRFFINLDKQLSTNVLTDRLKKLMGNFIIDVVQHPSNKTKKLYYLTERGISMIPILVEIKLWSLNTIEMITNRDDFIKKTIDDIRIWNSQLLSIV